MISVCMATYNGEKYIKQQMDSILSQLSVDDEIIVSDDGSKDKTIDILRSYHDGRIKIFSNNGRHGFVGNFENSLKHAMGDYIFLCDQDDYWKPNKVEVVLNKLRDYDLVIHNAELVDGQGRSLGKTYYDCTHHKTSFWANFYKTRWLGCCMAFRKNVRDYCLPIPPKLTGHDYWIGMLGMLRFKYAFMDEILMCYRRHGDNLSPSGEKSNHSLWYMLVTKRWNLVVALFRKLL